MPFHVEIRHGFRRAWAFNLSEEKLRRTILTPLRQGASIKLGDREWVPRESTLRILEGEELSGSELAFGQGWHNAERSGTDVTRRLLVVEEAPRPAVAVAIVAETLSTTRAVARLLNELQLATLDWATLRARIVDNAPDARRLPLGEGSIVAALLILEGPQPSGSWLFEAGLARGALGGRAILAQVGDGRAPPELSALDPLQLNPADPSSAGALAARLREAGLPVREG